MQRLLKRRCARLKLQAGRQQNWQDDDKIVKKLSRIPRFHKPNYKLNFFDPTP